MIPWTRFLAEFARSGNLTLGGGQPMIAELHRRVIHERKWLPPEDFGLLYGISRLTPGTNVLAFTAAMAARIKGWRGGVAAVIAASLPASIVVWAMVLWFERWSSNPWVAAGTAGAMAGVVALILSSAWQLMEPIKSWRAAWILAAFALFLGWQNVASPITILLGAGAAGAWLTRE